jgi:hypothetical protein
MNESCIPDHKFDQWCRELVKLQEDYPEEARNTPFAKEFEGFDGSTGFHLSDNTWGLYKAEQILKYYKERVCNE